MLIGAFWGAECTRVREGTSKLNCALLRVTHMFIVNWFWIYNPGAGASIRKQDYSEILLCDTGTWSLLNFPFHSWVHSASLMRLFLLGTCTTMEFFNAMEVITYVITNQFTLCFVWILQHQMDPSSNFYNYRTALRGATQRSITAHSSREKVKAFNQIFLQPLSQPQPAETSLSWSSWLSWTLSRTSNYSLAEQSILWASPPVDHQLTLPS